MKLSLFSKPAGDGDFFESIKFFLGKIVVVAHDRYAVTLAKLRLYCVCAAAMAIESVFFIFKAPFKV